MSDVPFWQSKTLDEMSDAEWESLCDGCGQCCLHKLMDEDTDEIYFTNVACRQLNIKTCQCRNYERRFEFEPDCIKLTRENLPTFEWLPMTCAYRLLAEGKDLPAWHPLLTGSKAAMQAGHRYQKAGVMLGDFFSQGVAQLNLFDDNAPRPGSEQLMTVMDTLNAKEGRGTLYFAGQGIQQQWQMKRAMLSPRYTTRSSDLLRVK